MATCDASVSKSKVAGEVKCGVGYPRLDDAAHAALVQAFVRWLRSKPWVWTNCEVPYNFYGERGVIDVLALMRPTPAAPWYGIACELKPELLNLNETMRQVTKAQNYFQLPSSISAFGRPILRFPLVLQATEHNYVTVTQYADVLDGIEIHFFDVHAALSNPLEQAWRQHCDDSLERQRAMHPPGNGNPLYEDCFSSL